MQTAAPALASRAQHLLARLVPFLAPEQSEQPEVTGRVEHYCHLGAVTLPVVVDGVTVVRPAPLVLVAVEGDPDSADARAAGQPFVNPLVEQVLRAELGVVLPEPVRGYEGGIDAYLGEVEKLLAPAVARLARDAADVPEDQGEVAPWEVSRDLGVIGLPAGLLGLQRDVARHAGRIAASPLLATVAPDIAHDPRDRVGSAAADAVRTVEVGPGADAPAGPDALTGDEDAVVTFTSGASQGVRRTAIADLAARRARDGRRVLLVSDDGDVRAAVTAALTRADEDADAALAADDPANAVAPVDLDAPDAWPSSLAALRAALDAGADADRPVEPLHVGAAVARDRLAALDGAADLPVDALGPDLLRELGGLESRDLRARIDALASFAAVAAQVPGGVAGCPWRGSCVDDVSHDFRAQTRIRLDELNLRAKQANIAYQTMERETGLAFEPSVGALDAAAGLFDHILQRPDLPDHWTLETDFDALEALRATWEDRSAELMERVHALHDRAVEVLGEPGAAPGADATNPAEAATPAPACETSAAPADATPSDQKASASPARHAEAPLVGDVSERPGYVGDPDDGDLRASAAIDRYAKLVGDEVADRIAADPCFSNWAASRPGDVRAVAERLEQFVCASENLRAQVLRDYAKEVLAVDYAAMEGRFSPEGASWFKRLFNFAHRRDLKELARLRKQEAGGARNYRDADARAVLGLLRALANVHQNTEDSAAEYKARFGTLYAVEKTDLRAVQAKMDAYQELSDLRDLARDLGNGIIWADLDAQGLDDAFGSLYPGDAIAADWGGSIASCLAWARRMRERSGELGVEGSAFAADAMAGFPQDHEGAMPERCARWSARLHDTVAACEEQAGWFAARFEAPATILDLPAADLAARADACVNDLKALERWNALRVERDACADLGLAPFLVAAAERGVAEEELPASFERAFWRGWLAWGADMRARERTQLEALPATADAAPQLVFSAAPELATSLAGCVAATHESAVATFGAGDFMFDTAVVVEDADPQDVAHDDAETDDVRLLERLAGLARAHQTILVRR